MKVSAGDIGPAFLFTPRNSPFYACPCSEGGPTQTIPLLPGSPAIDAGNPNGCTDSQGHLLKTDQRGMPRPDREDQTGCDMGAYERQCDWPRLNRFVKFDAPKLNSGSVLLPPNLRCSGGTPLTRIVPDQCSNWAKEHKRLFPRKATKTAVQVSE